MNLRKVLLLIIFIITIIFAFFRRTPMSIMPFVFLLVSLVISLAYSLIIWKSVKIVVDNSKKKEFIRSSKNKYNIKIRNRGFLVLPYIVFKLELIDDKGFTIKTYEYKFVLNPKEEKEIKIDMEFPHIGRYKVKITSLEISGIFDIYALKTRPNWVEEISVVPKLYKVEDFKINTHSPSQEVDFNVNHKIDGRDFSDVREYEEGDSMKDIHWKLSAHMAHQGKYMTKILENDAVSGVSIFLDLSSHKKQAYLDGLKIHDILIESAYAIGDYTILNGYKLNLIYMDSNKERILDIKDYEDFYRSILSIPRRSNNKSSMEVLLMNNINAYDNNIIITDSLTDKLLNTIIYIRDRKKFPSLLLIDINENITKDQEEKLSKSGIYYHILRNSKDIKKIVGGSI